MPSFSILSTYFYTCHYFILLYIFYAVSQTDAITVLLSDAYCSCVEISCDANQGTIHIAIANPDTEQKDIICTAALGASDLRSGQTTCYDINECDAFRVYNYPPFIRICENPMDSTRCSVCFQNTNKLNVTRLDLFSLQRNTCTQSAYFNRLYFKSMMLNGNSYCILYSYIKLKY